MSDVALNTGAAAPRTGPRPDLTGRLHPSTGLVFVLLLAGGLAYAGYGLVSDIRDTGQAPLALGTFALLGLALLIALGFEPW